MLVFQSGNCIAKAPALAADSWKSADANGSCIFLSTKMKCNFSAQCLRHWQCRQYARACNDVWASLPPAWRQLSCPPPPVPLSAVHREQGPLPFNCYTFHIALYPNCIIYLFNVLISSEHSWDFNGRVVWRLLERSRPKSLRLGWAICPLCLGRHEFWRQAHFFAGTI